MGTAPNMQIEENLALAYRRGRKRGLKWGVTNAEREIYRESLRPSASALRTGSLPRSDCYPAASVRR